MPEAEVVAGVLVIALVQYDVFQTVIVPRPSTSGIGLARYIVALTWPLWRRLASAGRGDARERRLGVYAPSAVVALLAFWGVTLVFGYGLVFHGLRDELQPAPADLWESMYFAGTSILTIGFGDIAPIAPAARAMSLAAGANGLIVVALAITFLFSLYASFQRREVHVVTLDARAGAPPSGVQLLETAAQHDLVDDLPALFESWESWAAEVLDSHLAYPLLFFFRSSHDNESWVSALGAVLDAATLCLTTVEGCPVGRAKLVIELGAHLGEDVTAYFHLDHAHGAIVERAEFDAARARLAAAGWSLREAEAAWAAFEVLRGRYATELDAMARFWAVPPAQWIGDRSPLRHATA